MKVKVRGPISEIGFRCRSNTEVWVMKMPNHGRPRLGFRGKKQSRGILGFFFSFFSFLWLVLGNPLARSAIIPFPSIGLDYCKLKKNEKNPQKRINQI